MKCPSDDISDLSFFFNYFVSFFFGFGKIVASSFPPFRWLSLRRIDGLLWNEWIKVANPDDNVLNSIKLSNLISRRLCRAEILSIQRRAIFPTLRFTNFGWVNYSERLGPIELGGAKDTAQNANWINEASEWQSLINVIHSTRRNRVSRTKPNRERQRERAIAATYN